ncbi:MAG: GNAT family N-acetyltransferase, partial [Acidobacteriota bacterium]
MAALPEQPRAPLPTPLVELRDVYPGYLDSVLAEESADWLGELDWNFEPAANLVRRFIGMRALTGFALPSPNRTQAVGYCYYVADDGKGLIGGLYVSPAYRTPENENALITAALDAMWKTPGIRRIEAQLMMLESPLQRAVPHSGKFRPHARKFLEISLKQIVTLAPRDPAVAIAPWAESRQSDAARLIAAAYAGHIDSQINDQYRSPGGARRFLMNIVEYPGCGSFFTPASFVAFAGTGPGVLRPGLCGMSLASIVSPGIGHITQVCVAPSHLGTGLGYELLRRSLVSLAAEGCHKVSLTVTSANGAAARLYQRMGFVNRRDFAAYV